jgi:hypothetical protein
MKQEIVKFYGKEISCVKIDNRIMVGVKPICENIGLDFQNQYELIKNDDILSGLYGVHHIVAADGKEREMNCIPLEFIPGWLFQVKISNTMNENTKIELKRYKLECHNALANHFFGNLKKQIETNELEIALLSEINEMNEQKHFLSCKLKEKKTLLEKIREERLKNEPTLFD